MKKQWIGFSTGFLVAVLIFSFIVPAFAAYQKQATLHYSDIKIILDGKEIVPKDVNGNIIEPFIIDGTTFLPVRGVAAALGLDVQWEAKTNTVSLESAGYVRPISEYYKEFPSVPNLGYYLDIEPFETSEKGGVYSYEYNIGQVASDFHVRLLTEWEEALTACNFIDWIDFEGGTMSHGKGLTIVFKVSSEKSGVICTVILGETRLIETPTPTPVPTATPTPTPTKNPGYTQTYYWTPNGKSYHSTSGCRSLARSTDIRSGTLSQAFAAGKTDPCNNCIR